MRALPWLIPAVSLLLLLPVHLEGRADEPNNDPTSADELSDGVPVADGLNETSDQVDWFRMPADRGKVLNVSLLIIDWPDLDASLEVYDKRLDLRQGYSISPHPYETVILLTASSGHHYIRVFVYPGGGAGRYSLTAKVQDPIDAAPGERLAGTLTNNTNHHSDIYRTYVQAGDQVSARLTEEPLFPKQDPSLDLYLMDLWPNADIYHYLDVSWWSDPVETVRGRAAHDGYHYLIVTAFNGSGKYALELAVEAGTPGEDDFPPLERPVFSRAQFNDSLDQSLDPYDWFRLSALGGQLLSVEVLLQSGWREGIFELYLFDEALGLMPVGSSEGGPVYSLTNVLMANGSVGGVADRIGFTVTFSGEGTYHVLLRAKHGLSPADPNDTTDSSAAAEYSIKFSLPKENHPPAVAHPLPALGMDEDGSLALRLSQVFDDADIPEGDRLTFQALGSPHIRSTLERPDGVVLEPSPDWSGQESLTFSAVDSLGVPASLTVMMTVNAVPDAPRLVLQPERFNFNEGFSYPAFLDLSALFSDPDLPFGDSLAYSISPTPLNLYMEPPGFLSSGTILSSAGEYIVTVRARDLFGLEADVYLNISVIGVPHSPRAKASHLSMQTFEDTPLTGPVAADLFEDPDGDPLTIRITNLGRLRAELDDLGRLVFTPERDWHGAEDVFIEARDGSGLAASLTINVTVKSQNDPPVILSYFPSENLTITEGAAGVLRLVGGDAETPGGLTYEWRVDGVKVDPRTSHASALPLALLRTGNHIVTGTVYDPEGAEASRTWAITVTPEPGVAPEERRAAAVRTAGGAAAAVGVGAWLLAFFLSEPGKYGLLKLLVVPLYTKIRKEEVLDHFTRGRIYGMVESSPGVHYTLIKRKLGVGNGTLTYHLATLEREGFIRSEWDGLYKRFYPSNAPHRKEEPVEPGSVQGELLKLVRERPGISQKELGALTGLSKRVISYHVSRMCGSGLLRVERDGKLVRCYPPDGAS